jgi:hypothetical protein
MKHFTDGKTNETPEQEFEALMADIEHLRSQFNRYGRDESRDMGGVAGVLMREKTRLFNILHGL